MRFIFGNGRFNSL